MPIIDKTTNLTSMDSVHQLELDNSAHTTQELHAKGTTLYGKESSAPFVPVISRTDHRQSETTLFRDTLALEFNRSTTDADKILADVFSQIPAQTTGGDNKLLLPLAAEAMWPVDLKNSVSDTFESASRSHNTHRQCSVPIDSGGLAPNLQASSPHPSSSARRSSFAGLPKRAIETANEHLSLLVHTIKDKTGILPEHLLSLQRIAAEMNYVIGIRPVDRMAKDLIADGYPTKNMHIKGKSASWGPQTGFICTEQRFSKLENVSVEKISAADKKIAESINGKHAVSVPLVISSARFEKLLRNGFIENISQEDSEGVITFRAKAPSGRMYLFKALSIQINHETHFTIADEQGKVIEALAPRLGAQCFVPDYDLLMVSPSLSDLGALDNLSVGDVSHSVFLQRVGRYAHIPDELKDFMDPASFYQKEDPDLGNSTERIRKLLPIINYALAGDGERIVHHNADTGNPYTDTTANYPATFVLPKPIGPFAKICLVNNNEEFADFIQHVKDSGYHVPLNPLWEKNITKIRRSSFAESLEIIDHFTTDEVRSHNPKDHRMPDDG